MFYAPLLFDQFDSQPVRQLMIRDRLAGRPEIVDRWYECFSEMTQPEPDLIDTGSGRTQIFRACHLIRQCQAVTAAGTGIFFAQRGIFCESSFAAFLPTSYFFLALANFFPPPGLLSVFSLHLFLSRLWLFSTHAWQQKVRVPIASKPLVFLLWPLL